MMTKIARVYINDAEGVGRKPTEAEMGAAARLLGSPVKIYVGDKIHSEASGEEPCEPLYNYDVPPEYSMWYIESEMEHDFDPDPGALPNTMRDDCFDIYVELDLSLRERAKRRN